MNWEGFTRTRHDLKRPLLVVSGSKGVLACSYLDVATFTKLDEAGAIVSGVSDFDAMLKAKVVAASPEAVRLGVDVGMTGREALKLFR